MSYSCQQTCMTTSWSCLQAVATPVWNIPLLCVQWKTPDDGQRNCPKHVEFYSKNTFEKLLHLVGFIIRICKKLSSPFERQMYSFFEFVFTESITECNTERSRCPSACSYALSSYLPNTFRLNFVLGVYKRLLFEYKVGSVVPVVTLLRTVHIYRSVKMVYCYVT
jgi:hypothetical protein